MTKKIIIAVAVMIGAVTVAGCATEPSGPSVAVMPAANKPFEVFASEQAGCESYASQQVAGQAEKANRGGVVRTLITSALGAGLGGAIGGGNGAVIGAASGGLLGAARGHAQDSRAADGIQRRYDIAFEQCMYAKGNQVPGFIPASVPPTTSEPPRSQP